MGKKSRPPAPAAAAVVHAGEPLSARPSALLVRALLVRAVILIAFGIALAACQTPAKRSPVAHFTRDWNGRYEIRLDYTYWSNAGGPCSFPSPIPEKIEQTNWIYTQSMDGEIPADQSSSQA